MSHQPVLAPSAPPRLSAPGRRASAGPALAVAALAAGLLAATYALLVLTATGQRLDESALTHLAASSTPRETLADVLREVTVGSIVAVLAACVVVAVLRRQWVVAAGAVVLVAGANVTTQVLKHWVLERPSLGYESTNTLPSGHTTVVTSLALAALLVAPRGWRFVVSLAAVTALAVTGVGTVVANWHRPSDVVAAFAVSLCWAGLVLAALSSRTAPDAPAARSRGLASHPITLMAGLALSAALFLAFGVRPNGSERDLLVHVVTMCGLALAGAAVVAVHARLVNARVP